jgi:tryptophanase
MKTIIEPFRIKAVEPIRLTSFEERQALLQAAHYNTFLLNSDDVIIDLLTDSGTSAMSATQWSVLMRGDESYAGSPSYHRFKSAVKKLMPFKHILPTHQGRAAESILFSLIGGEGKVIPSNTHFDTTRSNIEASGAEAHDLVIEEGMDPALVHPFKGNMDIAKLDAFLRANEGHVPCVMTTITNNAGGGQPVSMDNIRRTGELAHKYGIPFFIDSCRFAENAYFIKMRDPGFSETSVSDIVRMMFSYADGMTMSAKKDAFANIGGWLALNDDALAEKARTRLIQIEGFPTYGGLAGRDLEAIAQGLSEIVDEDYLAYRLRTCEYVVEQLVALSVPVVLPAGGHAVFVDARAWLPHIPPLEYPGQAVVAGLYEFGGIRSCEIGTVMFGRKTDGSEEAAAMDLVRLAMPRRVYTQSHADYVVEVFAELNKVKEALTGFRIIEEPPSLRHFTSKFERITSCSG